MCLCFFGLLVELFESKTPRFDFLQKTVKKQPMNSDLKPLLAFGEDVRTKAAPFLGWSLINRCSTEGQKIATARLHPERLDPTLGVRLHAARAPDSKELNRDCALRCSARNLH